MARGGLESASARAPLDVWPGADVGHARGALARAHPLLEAGVVRGAVFGRTLAYGGVELQAPLVRSPVGVGSCSATPREPGIRSTSPRARTQVDVGIGLRVRMTGQASAFRIDLAHGFRDGRTAISGGWQLLWPD